jgi:hypothetical protein
LSGLDHQLVHCSGADGAVLIGKITEGCKYRERTNLTEFLPNYPLLRIRIQNQRSRFWALDPGSGSWIRLHTMKIDSSFEKIHNI